MMESGELWIETQVMAKKTVKVQKFWEFQIRVKRGQEMGFVVLSKGCFLSEWLSNAGML